MTDERINRALAEKEEYHFCYECGHAVSDGKLEFLECGLTTICPKCDSKDTFVLFTEEDYAKYEAVGGAE